MRAQADESRAELRVKLAALERENAVLRAREDASRAREAASSRIFQAIAADSGEAARALDLIAESAALLCGACDAVVLLLRDDHLVRGGHYGPIPTNIERLPVSPRWTAGRCVLERRPVHVHDLLCAGGEFPDGAALARRLGHRTIVSVPLLRRDEAVGSITLRRFEVRPFAEDEIALLATLADQAVIAIENTRLFGELHESLRQQTATADVLKAISQSAFDLQRVFEAVGDNALRLCGADKAFIFRFDGEVMRSVVAKNASPELLDYIARNPITPGRHSATARAALLRQTVHIEDVSIDPDYTYGARDIDPLRTNLAVPILKGDDLLGVITIYRLEVKSFTQNQIALIETFADQAAIAIDSVRLLTDLRDALQQQTAMADVLKAISRSTFDLRNVLSTLVQAAVRLCEADQGTIARERDGLFVRVASHGFSPEFMAAVLDKPVALDRGSATGRALTERRLVHIPDVALDPDYDFAEALQYGGFRTLVGVPMLRDGAAIGVFALTRKEARPFTEKQMELLASFADQAAIAIENARLFEAVQGRTAELEEALEQQTATSAILRVIASSPADLAPVLSAVAENAARLCGAADAQIFRVHGDMLHLEASFGPIPIHFREARISRGWVTGRAVVDGRTIHVHDLAAEPEDEFPLGREMQSQHGHRTTLATPLLKQGSVLGAILIRRMEVQPFSDDQIRLLETFADQAAIAIENARLFEAVESRTREVQEALEYQTATSEVLGVISRSPTDAQPVFIAITESARRLCGALFSMVYLYDGTLVRIAASNNVNEHVLKLLDQFYPRPPDRFLAGSAAILDRRMVHLPNVLANEHYSTEIAASAGWKAVLALPILRDGEPVGSIAVAKADEAPFSERQIQLLRTFADQAVIAIENVRLFEEVQTRTRELEAALEQQTATSEILSAISTSMTEAQPVFDAIVRSAVSLCDSLFANVFKFDGEQLHFVASHNVGRGYVELLAKKYPMRPDPSQVSGRVIISKAVVRLEDARADAEYDQTFPSAMRWSKMLGVPMLRDGVPVGVIVVGWADAGPVPKRQEELLKTFADQAVIAIENARLFTELQVRNRDLGEALERQTATGEVLNVISRSPSDLRPVLQAIVAIAARLCQAECAVIFKLEPDGRFHIMVSHSNDEFVRFMAERPVTPDRGSVTGRTVLEAAPVHVADVLDDAEYTYLENQAKGGYRTALGVPLMRGPEVIGVIFLARRIVEPFTEKQIELVTTFADQGVIAIENARLFEALQSALAEFNAVLDNIDYGVLFMDRDLRTRIVNPALRRLWDIPQEVIDRRPAVAELFEYNRDRGVYTTPPESWDQWVAARVQRIRDGNIPPGEFARADGKVYSYQCVALPNGGRMLSYFDITELKNRQAELLKAKEAAETALAELRTAQERLVQSEKLASLGQLTAGIAHEIKNPLNFVNNFASLSRDLLAELEAALQAPISALETAERDDAEDLFRTVRENLDKIARHGKRADSIVKNMLLHARQGSGEWRQADINAIAEEALNLAYHGARAGHPEFNVEIVKRLDPDAGAIECCPQDIMRVVLNLVSNGIYAANKKRPTAPAGFVPRIDLATRADQAGIAIEVRDNGTGIPADIRESIFLPFFTTKPAGEGTGLGLSLSHDIVVKQHGGSFSVESEPGAFTCFRVVLPRRALGEKRAEA